ncbi:MAG: RDD family protein [Deltaproteobacteria bacterium]|nr:RDD family protein [Deltaproteobacteria bacterium]MCL5276547.1 RDD family protein [Deltaproteobacteria bacterium]
MTRATFLERASAKFIDGTFALILASVLSPIGPAAGLVYSLIADGLMEGRSVGKALVGIRVVEKDTSRPCSIHKSVLRNIPFGFAILMFIVPVIGMFLFIFIGLGIIGVETYFLYTDLEGVRIGDSLADTIVVRKG